MPEKVAIYIRVSTQEQAQEGYSIEAQTDRLTAYCKAKDWPIVGIYKDPGYSGATIERPALRQLFDDIDAGKVDCVLVYKLDRLSRSQKDTLYIIEDVFLAHNVAFVSMQENFDTSTPFGRAMIGILSVFAQLEREQIKERTAMGRAARAKSGLWHGGGWRPYGYNYIDGKLVVNPTEAVVVHDVFDMFLRRTPITSIVNMIKDRFGQTVNQSLVRSMLSTPLYLGLITWEGNTYQGQHEPIIDKDRFDRAQELLDDRSRIAASKPNPFRPAHLLAGLIYCSNCGSRYIGKGNYSGHGSMKKYRPYYTCYSRAKSNKRFVVDPNCKNPSYACVDLDERIIKEIERMVDDEKYFKAALKESLKPETSDDSAVIMRRIDELERQISRVIDLYQLGTINIDEIGERTKKLQEERDALRKTLKSIKKEQKKKDISPQEARSVLKEFSSVMATGDMESKQAIVKTLINKIIALPKQGEIEIIWNF